jgi:hypothetical protein
LFDSADLFKFIDDWFKQNGYEKNEIKNIERVGEKGKYVSLEIMPYKEINDYTRFEVYVRIRINDLVETKVKKEKQELKINKGRISISIDAFLASDIRYRWASKPFYFLLRTIFNRFVYKEYVEKFERSLMEDVKSFHSELKAYLNLERYKEQA